MPAKLEIFNEDGSLRFSSEQYRLLKNEYTYLASTRLIEYTPKTASFPGYTTYYIEMDLLVPGLPYDGFVIFHKYAQVHQIKSTPVTWTYRFNALVPSSYTSAQALESLREYATIIRF